MMWRDVIELGQATETVLNGEVIKSYVYSTVYANKRSVTGNEFYEAKALGIQPEVVFEIHTCDFDSHEKILYNSKVYDIVRVAEKGDFTLLTVMAEIGS